MFDDMASTKDALTRELEGYALGINASERSTAWLLAHLDDARLSTLDRRHMLDGLMEEPESRALTLPWMTAHAEFLLGDTSSWSRQQLVALAQTGCDADQAARFKAAAGRVVAGDHNTRLALAAAMERVHACVAVKSNQAAAIARVFRSLHARDVTSLGSVGSTH